VRHQIWSFERSAHQSRFRLTMNQANLDALPS
jgi:hypothetical protein